MIACDVLCDVACLLFAFLFVCVCEYGCVMRRVFYGVPLYRL